MKNVKELASGWALRKIAPTHALDPASLQGGQEEWLSVPQMPAQVHDILLEHGLLPEKLLLGWADEAEWIDQYDWVYRCTFAGDPSAPAAWLWLHGVDTVADIYLNGEQVASHNDFYLSEKIDVTGKLRRENTLLVHFHNITDYWNSLPYPEEWHETVSRCKLVRKPIHDFPSGVEIGTNYQGVYKYYSPIGLYDRVELITVDNAEITGDWLRATLERDLRTAGLSAELSGRSFAGDVALTVRLLSPDGQEVQCRTVAATAQDGLWKASVAFDVDAPEVWWPRGFGGQPLYTVRAELTTADGIPCDVLEKKVGFRHIEMPYPLAFTVNGKKVRMWGGSMDPFQGWTHCLRMERVHRLLDMIENAHMNTLRIWGEGIPQPDAFYEECDRRGVIVWQEFFHGFSGYPNSKPYRAMYRAEAEELILRLRHHTSLFMWCGGNETIMGSEFLNRESPIYGIEPLMEDYPELVGALDPGRYYHLSSPSGGEWANDPRVGDHHTYDCIWYYPYKEFPNFTSEHIRTAPPAMHSLKKIIRGDLWPEDYDSRFYPDDVFPMPPSWMERSNHSAQGHIKTGPYWEYYDADNAYDMVYRFAAAYGQEMRDGLERIRMGGPDGSTPPARRSKGHFSCKLNDTWPKVYCAVIDFFQEGFHPYYATLRGQEPVLVCFDVRDEIKLWLVNDSAEDIAGTVHFGLFDIEKNSFVLEKCFPAAMAQGTSDIVFDLNDLRFFKKSLLLYARFEDETGRTVNTSIDYVDIERHYKFPKAQLDVRVEGDELLIETDRFARCVEITGIRDGDEFGWLFSDNYFDLVPGETKRVRVVSGDRGEITVKAHYSPHRVIIPYEAPAK